MESTYSVDESRSAEEDSDRNQDYITIHSFASHSNLPQPRVIVQPSISEHIPISQIKAEIDEIPHQIPTSLLEVNSDINIARNQTNQSHSEEDLSSADVLSNSGIFHLVHTGIKDTSESPLYEGFTVPNPGDFGRSSAQSRAGIDVQGSSNFYKHNLSNCGANSIKLQNSSTLVNYNKCITRNFQQLKEIPQMSTEYVVKATNESDITDKPEAEKVYGSNEQGTESGIDNLDCDTINPNELVTPVVDIVEETVITTDSEHFCIEKAGSLVSYICGPCQTGFSTICHLHNHFENKHAVGTYIYYHDTKVAFPRLEGVCKNTQTDLIDFIEDDLTQFKNDEIDELDEFAEDLEDDTDIFEGIHVNENGSVDESENAGSETRKKKCNGLIETVDINLGEEKKSGYDNGDEEVGSGKGKRKFNSIAESADTSFRNRYRKKRCSDVTEVIDFGLGKGKNNFDDERKSKDHGCGKEEKKNGKEKGKTKHKTAEKQDSISVISVNSTSTRLCVRVKDINKVKEGDGNRTKNKRTRNSLKKLKDLKSSETVNKSKEANELSNDSSVEQMQNLSDLTEFANDSLLKTEEAENILDEEFQKPSKECAYFNVGKYQEKVLPSKLKLKETKKGKRASKNTVRVTEEAGSYSCKICATTYASKEKLSCHMTKIHRKVTNGSPECHRKCRWCGIVFPGSQSYTAHIRQCEKNENLICFICNRKLSSRFEVRNHLIMHRSTGDLKCQLCEKSFKNVMSLQRHLRDHNRPKNLQCEYCGKAFSYYHLLMKHMSYCNREPNICCPHCELKFKTLDAVKHHMSVHSNDRPFVCHICGYAGKKLMYLKRHLRSHTGERPYTCAECGMSFAAANGLNRHRKTHRNDKPCVCQYCGKSFVTNWNLKTHLRQHTGDTPYSCEQCGKAFKQNVLLKLHKKSHH